MKNCINCGSQIKGEERFCLNCGVRLGAAETIQPLKKVLTPKQRNRRRLSYASILVIAAALIGGHYFLQWKYDASRHLAEMNKAFLKGEEEEFLSYFTFSDDTVSDPESFYSYVETEGWEGLRERLLEEVTILENDELSNIIDDSMGNKFLSVTNDSILFGMYDRISFNLKPIEVHIELPLDKTTLAVRDLDVSGKQGEVKSLGKFLPGIYAWKATVPSEYAVIEDSGDMAVIGEGDNTYRFIPPLKAGMVSLTSDVEEAVLSINNITTEKLIKDTYTIGPFPFDGTIQLSAEIKGADGNVLKGKPVKVTSDNTHIEFAHVQEKLQIDRANQLATEEKQRLVDTFAEQAAEYINSFRNEFEYALNYADYSYISSFFPAGSEAQTIYMKEIENHGKIDGYYKYQFQSNTATGVEAVDAQTLYVKTAEVFYFYSDKDNYIYKKTKGYTVKVINGEMYILNIEQLTTDKESID